MAKPPVNWNNVSKLTPGLKNLGNQFNKRWPKRYGDSDGAEGDYAHSQGTSGHNPDDTSYDNAEWDSDSDNKSEIRAIDVDKDLNESGSNMQMVIDHMRTLPNLSSVIRYMIYNKKIYKASNGFKPETYTGSNTHTEHAHFSGAYSQSSDENTTFNYRFEEVGNMALTDADVQKIWASKTWDSEGDQEYPITMLRYLKSANTIVNDTKVGLKPEFDQLDASNAALATQVSGLKVQVDELKVMVAELTALIEGHVSGIIEGLNS
jgi:hypothetical protein